MVFLTRIAQSVKCLFLNVQVLFPLRALVPHYVHIGSHGLAICRFPPLSPGDKRQEGEALCVDKRENWSRLLRKIPAYIIR
jgi:hypothetical protein